MTSLWQYSTISITDITKAAPVNPGLQTWRFGTNMSLFEVHILKVLWKPHCGYFGLISCSHTDVWLFCFKPLALCRSRGVAEENPGRAGCQYENSRIVRVKMWRSRQMVSFLRHFKAAATTLCRHSVDRFPFHVRVREGQQSSVWASSLAPYFLHYIWRF